MAGTSGQRRASRLCPAIKTNLETEAFLRDLDSQRALNGLHAIAFDHVAGAHILIVFEGHAALLSGGDLLRVVLEPLELRQLAFVNDDVVADQADIRATLDIAFGDAA